MQDARRATPVLLAIAYVTMLFAARAILASNPGLETRTGRHLVAGALAVTALVVVEVMICLIPLRRGETWALWAAAVPLVLLGIPIFILDATYGPRQTRVATLLPQAIAIVITVVLIVGAIRSHVHSKK